MKPNPNLQAKGREMVHPRITRHAVERYISRVDQAASPAAARADIARIIAGGKVRSSPRHWMRGRVAMTPGLRFIYWAEQPGVCALVLDGAVITIITRTLCRLPRFAAGGAFETEQEGEPLTSGRSLQNSGMAYGGAA